MQVEDDNVNWYLGSLANDSSLQEPYWIGKLGLDMKICLGT